MADAPAKQSKSDFIRSQPGSLSPAGVVEKAKAAGIELSKNLVYLVRASASSKRASRKSASQGTVSKKVAKQAATRKKSTPTKSTPKTATKKATSKTTSPGTAKSAGISKSDFIRQHPSLSAAEVIAAGKDQGLSFTSSLVYSVRGAGKAASKKSGATTEAKKTSTRKLTATEAAPSALAKTTTAKGAKVTASTFLKSVTPRVNSAPQPSGSVEDLLKAAAAELGLARALEILEGERARVRAVLGGRLDGRPALFQRKHVRPSPLRA